MYFSRCVWSKFNPQVLPRVTLSIEQGASLSTAKWGPTSRTIYYTKAKFSRKLKDIRYTMQNLIHAIRQKYGCCETKIHSYVSELLESLKNILEVLFAAVCHTGSSIITVRKLTIHPPNCLSSFYSSSSVSKITSKAPSPESPLSTMLKHIQVPLTVGP